MDFSSSKLIMQEKNTIDIIMVANFFEEKDHFILIKAFQKLVSQHSSLDLNVIFDELDISSLDELFKHIPDDLLIKNGLDVDDSLSELEATKYFEDISNKNKNNTDKISDAEVVIEITYAPKHSDGSLASTLNVDQTSLFSLFLNLKLLILFFFEII